MEGPLTAESQLDHVEVARANGKNPDLRLLALLLVVSSPVNEVATIFLVIYLLLLVFGRKVEVHSLQFLTVLYILIVNAVVGILSSGISFGVNFALSVLFYFPLIFFVAYKPSIADKRLHRYDIKKTLELYLSIEVVTSACTGVYFYFFGGRERLDIAFGDVIAGTFRVPLTYCVDSATKTFSFSIILVTFLYIAFYRKQCNKILLLLILCTVFVGSVNHLILAAMAAIFFAIGLRRPFLVAAGIGSLIFGYAVLQPSNLSMLQERLSLVFHVLRESNFKDLSIVGPKGEYVKNYFRDLANYPLNFGFTGVGLGQYSDRAAMYLTGEFVKLPIKIVSTWMQKNTLALYHDYVSRPGYLKGSFFYPYNAIFSLLAELGLLFSFFIGVFFIRSVNKIKFFSKAGKIFIVVFTILAGFVDHYYQYSQAWFLFVLVLFVLNSENGIHNIEENL